MKVKYDGSCYTVKDQDGYFLLTYRHFPTTEALKNHLKLMLLTIEKYENRENKLD